MKDLTVIIPVHKIDDEEIKMFTKAVGSVSSDSPLIFVGPKEVFDKINQEIPFRENTKIVENDETVFATQINKAVNECKTKYFTVLEFDDVFTKHYFENAKKYTEAYPDVFGYLTLAEAIDYTKQEMGSIGYINEAFWASAFSELIGYLDEESVMDYLGVNFTGAIFNTEIFKELGGLKPSIKLTFWHEFALRAIHKGNKMYVIPKVGYKHTLNRPNSLSDEMSKTVDKEEADWWINLAQQEFYYKKDRNKTYKK